MDDILAKKNRHLFLEEKDNVGNSFIANINKVAESTDVWIALKDHEDEITTVSENINNVSTVAENINDINTVVNNIDDVNNVSDALDSNLLESWLEQLSTNGNDYLLRISSLGNRILTSRTAFNYAAVVTIQNDIAASATITLPNAMAYYVGSHMLLLSWNGTVCYRGEQYNEVGETDTWSTTITTLVPLKAGDKLEFRTVAVIPSDTQVITSGTNTSRSLANRFADIVNVKDYGAVGDGTTNDTIAFQNAIATGKSVFVPEGNYKLTTNLTGDFCSTGNSTFTGGTVNGSTILRGTAQKNSDIINVKDFGAVDAKDAEYTNTILSNNALTIQAAINYAKTNGGSVYIPNGIKYFRSGVDAADVFIVDDSSGVRITSCDYWWHPSRNAPPKLILHRGLSSVYPENTVLAFDAAGIGGAWGIETDIQWTSDDYPVCMHDTTIDRTTDGTGTIQSKTLAQIRALDAGSWVDAAYSSCLVPTFEEYLNSCMLYGCVPVIEIKSADNVNLTKISGLIDTLRGYGLTEHAFFTAFNWSYLALVREKSKEIGVCGVKSGTLTEDNLKYLQWLGGKVYYGPNIDYLDADEVSLLRASGIDIYPWTGSSRYRYDVASRFGCGKVLVNNFFA